MLTVTALHGPMRKIQTQPATDTEEMSYSMFRCTITCIPVAMCERYPVPQCALAWNKCLQLVKATAPKWTSLKHTHSIFPIQTIPWLKSLRWTSNIKRAQITNLGIDLMNSRTMSSPHLKHRNSLIDALWGNVT